MYEIISKKSTSEIVGHLRSKGYQLDMIPSEISNGSRSSFAAVMHSSGGGMLGSRNEPGVKIAIYDLGNSRRVELEALSVSPMGQKFNLKKGEQLCDQLYSELNEVRMVAEPQIDSFEPEHSITPAPFIAEDPATTPAEPKKEDDFAAKFMKGFKEINPSVPSEPAVPEPTPEIAAVAAPAFTEKPKPDYIKQSVSTDEYSASPAGASTWRCEKCGKINLADSNYCGDCGTPKPNKGASGAGNMPTPKPPKPPVNKAVIIIAAVTILVLAVGIPIISKLTSAPSYDDEYYSEDYDSGYSDDSSDEQYDESYDSSYDSELPDDEDYEYENREGIYAAASSQRDSMGDIDYPPENAIDNDLATAWVEGADGDGIGEWISVTFANDDPILGLWIRNGYQKSEETYLTNNRVKEVYAEFEDGSVDKFTLEDKNNEAQPVFFSEGRPGNTVKLIINSVYHSEDELDTCITEIELLTAYGSTKPVIQAERVK